MVGRKKRIPFDPPGSKNRTKKPGRQRRFDQVFLSRRVLLIKGAVVAGFVTLSARLAQMQLLHGQEYTDLAEANSVYWKQRKPTRGLIFDLAGRPLAENRRTWEVRIIPSELPSTRTPEWDTVRERLITALRLPDCLIVDPNAVPRDTEDVIYRRVSILLGLTTDDDIQSEIDFIKLSAQYNYVVLIESNLSTDMAAMINSRISELPGIEVVNYLDYLVRNYRYQQTAITVKRDVERSVALKLEANRIYLPGVELDDSNLTRRYPGGPTMSHILGYVGKIQDGDLNDESNIIRRDDNGMPVYRTYDPDDYIGQTGIERQMEELLRGQKGGALYEQDAYGVELRELAGSTPAIPGRNLKLTVDLELQAAVSRALADGIAFSTNDRLAKNPEKRANTRGGAVVMMSPKTGEVFALASYPNYDNQLFIDGLSVLKAREYGLGIDPEEERKRKEAEERGEVYEPEGLTDHMINRAYANHYAPGSTVKIFLALAGLRDKYIDANTSYYCGGAIMVPHTWDESKGNNYFCWIRNATGAHGDVNVVSAIEQSCDIYFYNLGTPKQRPEGYDEDLHYYDGLAPNLGEKHFFEGMGIDRMKKNLVKRFWFGEPTRIQLPYEAAGRVPDPDWKFDVLEDYWSSGDTINTSIGQGDFLASPLQIAVNTASIANNGILYRPRIVHSIVDDDGNDVQVFEPEKLRRLNWEPEHLDLVKEGMRRVVHGENGSARAAYVNDQYVTKWPLTNPGDGSEEIIIGGKTGTAEVGAVSADGTYSEQHAWFTCYAPFDDPEVVVTVFLERGGEGSSYAVPIADKALRAYFESTGRRPRGTVLREDKQPISDSAPPPGDVGEPVVSDVPEE